MSIQSCHAALDLVGKLVRPAHGSERWALASGKPAIGKVVNIHFYDLDRPYLAVQYSSGTEFTYPHDLEVIDDDTMINAAHLIAKTQLLQQGDAIRSWAATQGFTSGALSGH